MSASDSAGVFRVLPYLQNPIMDAITVIWFTDSDTPGIVTVMCESGEKTWTSTPQRAEALAYGEAERAKHPEETRRGVPFKHAVRVTGLMAGTAYAYRVDQEGSVFSSTLRTAPDPTQPIRAVVYADSETEPESTGKVVLWPSLTGDASRRYPVDQTTGYAENLKLMASRNPDFVAVAGDLVETGGEQRDWDEFWRHNAGALGTLASHAVLFPALGNHENYAPESGRPGYSCDASARAVSKVLTYFEVPDNEAAVEGHRGRYYAITYGPITWVTLDSSNGLPDDSPRDTNFHLSPADATDGSCPPDFNPGSSQYRWLERTLAAAQRTSRFTLVQCHHAPYSSGPHGVPSGPPNGPPGTDPQSGVPIRVLTPLFLAYGVDAVFSGHDEMYEHSLIRGVERRPDGREVPHDLHFFDVGIGGDGLRLPDDTSSQTLAQINPARVFLAATDVPEVWQGQQLISGGRHYGHIELNVAMAEDGSWTCRIDPVIAFPLMDKDGSVLGWERRVYPDGVTLSDGLQDGQPSWVSGGAAGWFLLTFILLAAFVLRFRPGRLMRSRGSRHRRSPH